MSHKVFSFDIFDTVLTRMVAKPRGMFRLIRNELTRSTGKSFPKDLIDNFARARAKAELYARLENLRQGREEIKITDIYAHIRRRYGLAEEDTQRLIKIECDMEYAGIYPIAWAVSAIENLRKAHQKIIFVSDMYLPLELIEKMILKSGVYRKGEDKIYLSNEIGLTKFSGKLFKYILENENCLPGELCHCGDDAHSDLYMPIRLGISIYDLTPQEVRKELRFHHLKRLGKYFEKCFIYSV